MIFWNRWRKGKTVLVRHATKSRITFDSLCHGSLQVAANFQYLCKKSWRVLRFTSVWKFQISFFIFEGNWLVLFAFRRRVCLHKLMITLCERGQTRQLIEYPFINLQDEVNEEITKEGSRQDSRPSSHARISLQSPWPIKCFWQNCFQLLQKTIWAWAFLCSNVNPPVLTLNGQRNRSSRELYLFSWVYLL